MSDILPTYTRSGPEGSTPPTYSHVIESRCEAPVDPTGPLMLLSLDSGGGTRTLLQLEMLDTLMKAITRRLQPWSRTQLKPCNCFHIIAGSGAGGLIAIMLGRLRMSVREATESYQLIHESIYAPHEGRSATENSSSAAAAPVALQPVLKYTQQWRLAQLEKNGLLDADLFERKLADLLRARGEAPDAPFQTDGGDACADGKQSTATPPSQRLGNVLVGATQPTQDGVRPQLLRSYARPEYGTGDVDGATVAQAARATTAHPAVFRAARAGQDQQRSLVGPLMRYANPTALLVDESTVLDEGGTSRAVRVCVSVGAGYADASEAESAARAAEGPVPEGGLGLPRLDDLLDAIARKCDMAYMKGVSRWGGWPGVVRLNLPIGEVGASDLRSHQARLCRSVDKVAETMAGGRSWDSPRGEASSIVEAAVEALIRLDALRRGRS